MSERDVDVVDPEGDRGCRWLLSVGPVIREFVGTEFGVGQVQFKDGGEGGNEVRLLL